MLTHTHMFIHIEIFMKYNVFEIKIKKKRAKMGQLRKHIHTIVCVFPFLSFRFGSLRFGIFAATCMHGV